MMYIGAANTTPANTMLYVNGKTVVSGGTISSLESGGAITANTDDPQGFSYVINIDGTTIQSSSVSQAGSDISPLIINPYDGNIGIGTINPTYKLSVNGNIRSKEIVVETGWADYVFDKAYKLP